jgi:transposase
MDKIMNPYAHPSTYGGRRNTLLTLEDQNLVDQALLVAVNNNPTHTAQQLALSLDIGVDAMWVHRALKRLGLTHKKVEHHSKDKYTVANLRYYWRFCKRLHDIPLYLLKYMDESHFSARSK